jgi:signal transduction histidine kinase
MFSKSFKFRITLLFTLIFLSCSIILYLASYFIISSSISNEEHSFLRAKLLEYWAIYETGSLDLLAKEITLQRLIKEEKLYLIRIASRYNNTLFLYVPENWTDFHFEELDRLSDIKEGDIIKLTSAKTQAELEISSLYLPDKNILQIGISNIQRENTLARFRQAFFIILVPLFILNFLGGLFFASRFLRPVNNLVNVTQRIINTGQLDVRIPSRKNRDELDELIILFNQMLDKIGNLMISLRETLDIVAHEIRTPMTRLRGIAEIALRPPYEKKALKEALGECISESEYILTLLNTLLDISQAETGIMKLTKKKINLSELLSDMIDFYHYLAEEKKITLKLKLGRRIFIHADLSRMRQILANLLENAFKYTPAGGRIDVKAWAESGQVSIQVKNTGKGIAETEISHIWERFYRSKAVWEERGLGLGLSLAKAVVEAHAGEITVQSKVNEYTTFQVKIPEGL